MVHTVPQPSIIQETGHSIGWDGVQFCTAKTWETIVQQNNHLICEENLHPLFEIRWQRNQQGEIKYKDACAHLGYQICPPAIVKNAHYLQPLSTRFKVTAYAKDGETKIAGIFCYCEQCHTLLHIHIPDTRVQAGRIFHHLKSLRCHVESDVSTLWSLQDFTLSMPPQLGAWQLENFSFASGLSRIQLRQESLQLHICRLARAEQRLHNSSLPEVLQTLAGTTELSVTGTETECFAHRTPSIPRQILLRLQRNKSFITSGVRYIEKRDRILALVAESNKPIPHALFNTIWQNYDLLP